MDPLCRVEMFGDVRLLGQDRLIARFRSRKAAHLLACLALPPGRIHTRDALVDRFWPDLEPEAGRDNLSKTLSILRKALESGTSPPGEALVADRGSVRLSPAAVATDVQECEELLRQADQAPDPLRRADLLCRAVGLYQGELVPDCYDDWIVPEQRRWAERHVDALINWAQALEEAGDTEQALDIAARAAAADPLREEVCELRVRLYGALGRYADARTCFRDYERRVQADSGAEPSPSLRCLVDELRTTPRAAALPAPRIGAVLAPPPDSAPYGVSPLRSVTRLRLGPLPAALDRFHGRRQELEQLVEWLTPEDEQQSGRRGDARRAGDDAMMRYGDDAMGEVAGDAALPSSHHPIIPSSPPSSPRLVTITGPGGSGKTRLAEEVARRLAPGYHDRVALVPLESVDDPGRIADALVQTLHLYRSSEVDPMDVVAAELGPEPCLLVLDNFEQLLSRPGSPDARALLRQMLATMPALRLLVTSRQAIAMQGEQELRLAPLSTPAEAGMECESVALFLDRARGIDPAFRLTAHNTADVSALCDRLEGSPLAIEMAATWVRALSPGAVRERLERGSADLEARRQDVPARHHSLRAALEWSYRLLAPELQEAFCALSVFRGGWTLAAAEAVAGHGVPVVLADLAERSLLVVEEHGSRYRYLETVREYARELLRERGEDEARERHARHYLALAGQTAAAPPVPRRAGWWDLGRDYPNLHAALEWLAETGRDAELAQTVSTLERLWLDEGHHLRDGAAWADRALSLYRQPDATRASALRTAGEIARALGDDAAARQRYGESLSIARECGHAAGSLAATIGLARTALSLGDTAGARRLADECAQTLRCQDDAPAAAYGLLQLSGILHALGDQPGRESALQASASVARGAGLRSMLAQALYGLASVARDKGDPDRALALWDECAALDEQEGVRGGGALWALGMLAEERGEAAEAARWYGRYLTESLEVPNPTGVAEGLYSMAVRALRRGEPDAAARLMGAALRQISLMDVLLRPERRKDTDALVARLRESMGADRCDALLQEGWQMEPEAAIELALERLKVPPGS